MIAKPARPFFVRAFARTTCLPARLSCLFQLRRCGTSLLSRPRSSCPSVNTVTGGRNGYGAKLANIFSTRFVVETADKSSGQKYVQTFSDNMSAAGAPVISPYVGADYTSVSFTPDLKRFGMDCLDEATAALLCKRAVDMAGVLGKGVAVYLNGARIPCNSFADYASLYAPAERAAEATLRAAGGGGGGGSAPLRLWERVSERWEVGLALTDGTFAQVSFANSICTTKGGQHVAYIADQIAAAVADAANKKSKGVEVKPPHVKNYMMLFVNALIENPAFDSQTKETLTTRPKDFGSTAELSDAFIKRGACVP